MGWTIVRVLAGVIWLTIGLVYVLRAEVMGSPPHRGTALRLSPRGYRCLGALCLALAVAQMAILANDA